MIQIDTWTNCYDLNWKNLITPAAFSHPAKFSHGLIKRIYEHALAEGMIQPGGVVLDPFGGVGLGALYAMQNGLHWVGVELEPKFVELGRENIALWNERYSAHFPNWGSAQLLQGDSRNLSEVVSAAGLVVGSPPYAASFTGKQESPEQTRERMRRNGFSEEAISKVGDYGHSSGLGYGSANGQLSNLQEGDISAVISSPPFAGNTGGRGDASRNGIDAALFDRHSGGMKGGTGSDPANLDHLPMGTLRLAQDAAPPMAIVSSPPYASARPESNGGGVDLTKQWETYRASGGGQSLEAFTATQLKHSQGYGSANGQLGAMVVGSPPFADSVGPSTSSGDTSDDPDKRGGLFRDAKRRNDVNLTGTYGSTDGQLGGMKAGEVSAVVGSPPFENSVGLDDNAKHRQWWAERREASGRNPDANGGTPDTYGSTAGQIGATQGDTFWAAARLIVEQCALLLPPNGVAIWVTKRYIKSGQIVDFSQQWAALCEACGFEIVHWHRAMLVKDGGNQADIFGNDHKKTIAKKSFFRRLAEKNGSPPIDWEDVICTRKKPA